MKKMLVSCVLLFLDGFAVARNVVVVVRDYVGDLFGHVPPFTVTEAAPERLDLIEHGMPQQATPTQRTIQATTDQRPWLDRFVRLQHQPSFA